MLGPALNVLFRQALRDLDVNLLLGWLLMTAAIIIAFNVLADVLYGVLDPRIRQG